LAYYLFQFSLDQYAELAGLLESNKVSINTI
jgi:hypothetical protein